MTLGTQRGAPVAEICHEVRGIVLSRNVVPIAEWAAELARGLVSMPSRMPKPRPRCGAWSRAAS